MPKESQFIKGSDALHATKSSLLLLESGEKHSKQKGKEQIKVAKQVNYLCTKQNKNKTKLRKIRFKNQTIYW